MMQLNLTLSLITVELVTQLEKPFSSVLHLLKVESIALLFLAVAQLQ